MAIRIRRICSEDVEFLKAWKLYSEVFFKRRGYDQGAVDKAFRIVYSLSRTSLLRKREKPLSPPEALSAVFVYPFGSNSSDVYEATRAAAETLQPLPEELRPFPVPQRVVWKTCANSKSLLLRTDIATRSLAPVGCSPCGRDECSTPTFVLQTPLPRARQA